MSDLRDDVVVLDASTPFFHDRLDSAETRSALEKAVQAVFGRPLRIRVRLQKAATSEDPQINLDDPLIASAMALGARVSLHESEEKGD